MFHNFLGMFHLTPIYPKRNSTTNQGSDDDIPVCPIDFSWKTVSERPTIKTIGWVSRNYRKVLV
jgi:hypothetical protein